MTLCPFLCKMKYPWVKKCKGYTGNCTHRKSGEQQKLPDPLSAGNVPFSFPQSRHIRASEIYTLMWTHICTFYCTDTSSAIFCASETQIPSHFPVVEQRISMDVRDPSQWTLQIRLVPFTGCHTQAITLGAHAAISFLKKASIILLFQSYITAWWKWEHRSGAQNIPTILIAKET